MTATADEDGSSETALLARLRAGEEAAWRHVVRRWHRTLVGLAASVLGDRAAAEEAAQDAWLKIVAGIGGFERRASLSSWMCAIALNEARTRVRQRRRRAEVPLDAGPSDGVDANRFGADGHWRVPPAVWDVLDPERIVAGRTLWAHVATLIDALPPGQRAVLLLRDVEGLSAEEACRLLEIGPENQRVLLHRGRTRLRTAVEALLGGPAKG